ncbi:MAG: nucleotidyltransferase family protein [Chloroflexi bacterium]|nr:nucleotidyltransferase family protein [Chloroflexota bacterium]
MQVAAIVLTAGTSSRYGANKLLLPFGHGTIISTVVATLAQTPAQPILAVTGHDRAEVEAALTGLAVTFVHNPDFQAGEMLSSIQCGLAALREAGDAPQAALIVLGDQPLIQRRVVEQLIVAFGQGCGELIAPRHHLAGQRGHPVLIARQWWDAALALPAGSNVRHLLQAHRDVLTHIIVDTDSILVDVDTPEAYQAAVRSSE